MTTVELELTRELKASPGQVWAVVADYARDHEWRAGVRMTPEPAGLAQEGTVTSERLRLFGREHAVQARVVALEPGRSLSWESTRAAMRTHGSRTVEPHPAGALFTFRLVMEPEGVMALAAPLLRWAFSRRVAADLSRLEALVSPPCPTPARGRLFDRLDRLLTEAMAEHSLTALRSALALVFLWFGSIKLVPGLSPAEELAGRTIEALTFGLMPAAVALPVLAVWELAIGVGLLVGRRALRATLLLLVLQLLGTVTPLVLFADETWARFPIAPTLEGQYILKNVVLVAAAMVLGATVRGGSLRAEAVR